MLHQYVLNRVHNSILRPGGIITPLRPLKQVSRASIHIVNKSTVTRATIKSCIQNHFQSINNKCNSWSLLGGLSLVAGGTYLLNSSSEIIESKCERKSQRDDIQVTDAEAELIARSLQGKIDIPGVPAILEKSILKQIIKAFVKECPLILPDGVFNNLISGEAGTAGFESAVIRQLSDKIYIPIISKENQHEIVELICHIFFTEPNCEDVRQQIIGRSLDAVKNEQSRVQLAAELNSMINIPLFDEGQEQAMAEKLINMCFTTLESFIPQHIQSILKLSSPDELKHVRDNLVKRLNEKIDLPWASEEDEEVAFGFIIDAYLSFYSLNESTMTTDDLLDKVRYQSKIHEIELEAHREHSYDKEQRLLAQLSVLKEKEKKLLIEKRKELSWMNKIKLWRRE